MILCCDCLSTLHGSDVNRASYAAGCSFLNLCVDRPSLNHARSGQHTPFSIALSSFTTRDAHTVTPTLPIFALAGAEKAARGPATQLDGAAAVPCVYRRRSRGGGPPTRPAAPSDAGWRATSSGAGSCDHLGMGLCRKLFHEHELHD